MEPNKTATEGKDFTTLLNNLFQQQGYESDNCNKGVESASKDYKALFKEDPPQWVNDIWPSVALSVLHLAISEKTKLPADYKFPDTALKEKKTVKWPDWTSSSGSEGM
ncbi:MAG: hypothetical protein LUC43_02730 [Burkholderiales bacterium]|nr:hypothetical protein [Burkholderiales bacterium]